MSQGNYGQIHNREAFIANIARRLGRSSPLQQPSSPYVQGIPQHAQEIHLAVEERIALFSENWNALTGKVWLIPKNQVHEKIPAILSEIITALNIERIALWDHEQLNALDLATRLADQQTKFVPWVEMDERMGAEESSALSATMETESPPQVELQPPSESATAVESRSNWAKRSALLKATERCQLGIVWPDYAIANTGSLILRGGKGRGRSVSLLPEMLFAILQEDQIVNRLGEAFPKSSSHKDESDALMPSSFTVITGPSRSADIENDLTIGIHGPGKVFAAIIVNGEE